LAPKIAPREMTSMSFTMELRHSKVVGVISPYGL
jgi:hypothetical protein